MSKPTIITEAWAVFLTADEVGLLDDLLEHREYQLNDRLNHPVVFEDEPKADTKKELALVEKARESLVKAGHH